ncbi:hypothetical protein ACET3X_007867 [Alternaria dauci]|uniref:FAD-binding domain-containing protein n=1 Tax=Alternaria dauci TaxID=48095 RepID=A0ABR3UD74_9PLEO
MAARSLPATSWERGVAEPIEGAAAWADPSNFTFDNKTSHYTVLEPGESPTSDTANVFGVSSLRTWPGLFNGTAADHAPGWWKPAVKVDVLICGAGPFGLALGIGLARQGISFRIVDKSSGPCHTGRADAVHPRALELLDAWGLADEIANEGPLLNKFTIHRDGVTMVNTWTNPSETTKYKGQHVATQSQIERIYIRDLLRHQTLVERKTTLSSFEVDNSASIITARLAREGGEEETVEAKYLIGSDGASSRVREMIGVPFDGIATDCFFAILDCEFVTDYPHILGTGWVIAEDHGCAIFVPREQGHTRVYVQLTGRLQESVVAAHRRNKERRNESSVGETQVHEHGLTPDDALEHLKKIMGSWKIDFAGPLSWFAIWRVNERVARTFSTPDQRIHLGGDAAHVHSTMGAFGYNSTVYDATNLAWKLGLCIKGVADPARLLATYDTERRLSANSVIRYTGAMLRFICRREDPLPVLRGLGEEPEKHNVILASPSANTREAGAWLGSFFHSTPPLLMSGLGMPLTNTFLSPVATVASGDTRPVKVSNGVRAPNPRIALGKDDASYLYDALKNCGGRFHLILFVSDLQGPVRQKLAHFSSEGLQPGGFFQRYGGHARFNVVLVTKLLPHEADVLMDGDDLKLLRDAASVVYDDRAPDEDAHYSYAVNHARGAIVVVRPDLFVGTSAWPEDINALEEYFGTFLIAA